MLLSALVSALQGFITWLRPEGAFCPCRPVLRCCGRSTPLIRFSFAASHRRRRRLVSPVTASGLDFFRPIHGLAATNVPHVHHLQQRRARSRARGAARAAVVAAGLRRGGDPGGDAVRAGVRAGAQLDAPVRGAVHPPRRGRPRRLGRAPPRQRRAQARGRRRAARGHLRRLAAGGRGGGVRHLPVGLRRRGEDAGAPRVRAPVPRRVHRQVARLARLLPDVPAPPLLRARRWPPPPASFDGCLTDQSDSYTVFLFFLFSRSLLPA